MVKQAKRYVVLYAVRLKEQEWSRIAEWGKQDNEERWTEAPTSTRSTKCFESYVWYRR